MIMLRKRDRIDPRAVAQSLSRMPWSSGTALFGAWINEVERRQVAPFRDRILQVFWNLARNGLEAMPDGGLLQVRLSCSGESLLLTVRDQGHGMSRDEQRRIFEPFRSSRALGTGLGLAIVYQIVREHRGDIAVRSGPEVGTSFEVRLPLVSVTS